MYGSRGRNTTSVRGLMTKLEDGRDERKRKLQDGYDLDCHFEQSL